MPTVFWVVVILFVAGAALHLVSLRYVTRGRFDETHHVRLPGGRPLALYRIRPTGETKRNHPVICCHGLGACRFNLALPGKHSVAHRLAAEGYDVWVCDLSGFGRSVPENWREPGRFDVRFEDFVLRDAPAMIDRIRRETGADRLFWVGHSMGGMAAYGVAQTEAAQHLRGAVAIASPTTLSGHSFFKPVTRFDLLIRPFPRLDLGWPSRITAPLLRWLPGRLHQPVLNARNMDLEQTKYTAANVISTTPMPLLMQFSRWIKTGVFVDDRGYNYFDNMHRITTPILCMSAAADHLVPAACVTEGFEKMSSADKTYIHFSSATGGENYGHGDIIFGRNAPEIVFPRVVDWLNARDGA